MSLGPCGGVTLKSYWVMHFFGLRHCLICIIPLVIQVLEQYRRIALCTDMCEVYPCDVKSEFSASLFQSSVSHDSSEIIIRCKKIFKILILIK